MAHMDTIRLSLLFFVIFLAAGCASLNNTVAESARFEEVLRHPSVITLPYKAQKDGLILVENIGINDENMTFALDTGATHSAIFNAGLQRLNLEPVPDKNVVVHGMIESGSRDVIVAPNLTIGAKNFGQTPLVVLADRDLGAISWQSYDGIIGMDVLANYKLYFSKDAEHLKFIPDSIEVSVPNQWRRVKLTDVRFKNSQNILHTMDIDLVGKPIPALLDTGAEFSVINWEAIENSELKDIKRRLKLDWHAQGAVGTFSPTSKVSIDKFRGGQIYWDNKDFVVMELNDIEALGARRAGFAIAGMNLLWDETLLIDFNSNYIAMKPRLSK